MRFLLSVFALAFTAVALEVSNSLFEATGSGAIRSAIAFDTVNESPYR